MQLSLLKMNSTGLLVKNWQFFLTGQQLFTGVASGKFDAETKSATITFQQLHQLQPDGIVGNKTWGMAMQFGFGAVTDTRTDRSGENFPPPPRFHPLLSEQGPAKGIWHLYFRVRSPSRQSRKHPDHRQLGKGKYRDREGTPTHSH